MYAYSLLATPFVTMTSKALTIEFVNNSRYTCIYFSELSFETSLRKVMHNAIRALSESDERCSSIASASDKIHPFDRYNIKLDYTEAMVRDVCIHTKV